MKEQLCYKGMMFKDKNTLIYNKLIDELLELKLGKKNKVIIKEQDISKITYLYSKQLEKFFGNYVRITKDLKTNNYIAYRIKENTNGKV